MENNNLELHNAESVYHIYQTQERTVASFSRAVLVWHAALLIKGWCQQNINGCQ